MSLDDRHAARSFKSVVAELVSRPHQPVAPPCSWLRLVNASGRRRHPSARQRKVVRERDRACVDCGSTELLVFDHVPSFEETGHTVVNELELRCWRCHRDRHRRLADDQPSDGPGGPDG